MFSAPQDSPNTILSEVIGGDALQRLSSTAFSPTASQEGMVSQCSAAPTAEINFRNKRPSFHQGALIYYTGLLLRLCGGLSVSSPSFHNQN